MGNISRDLRMKLLDVTVPHFHNLASRQDIITMAFGDTKIPSLLNYDGNARTFTTHVFQKLEWYGPINSEPAVNLLLSEIQERVGPDKADEIEELKKKFAGNLLRIRL